MATGALDANGIYQYGEDDNEPTFSGLLNKSGTAISNKFTAGALKVASGGTGRTELTSGTYLKGNGTSAVTLQTGIPIADVPTKFGEVSAVSDTSGDVIITHGLGRTPTSVQVTNATHGTIPDRRTYATHSYTSTTFKVRCYRQDTGGTFTSNYVGFYWLAF